jgi:hypothetical protein
MNKTILTNYVQQNGNCVNLGRTLKARDFPIYQWVIDSTPWLNDVPFNERVYCILNDIQSPLIDAFNKPARFINLFRGYSLKMHTKGRADDKAKKEQLLAEKRQNRPAPPTKLERLIQQNRKQYAHLYDPSAVNGIDYVECPVTGIRLRMITTKHISSRLDMSVEEFDTQFPNYQKVSQAHIDAIKVGVQTVDSSTGLTKYQISQIKAREKLSMADENGVTGYKKKGEKTRNTHMNKIDEHGRNGYSQIAVKAIVKGNETKAKKGLILSLANRRIFYRYKKIVTYLTERLRAKLVKGYITGLAGTPDAWHIDHRYSIMHGYLNEVSPLVIGHEYNLQMIPWEENIGKHSASSITLPELLTLCDCTPEQSNIEFALAIDLIMEDIDHDKQISGGVIEEQLRATRIRTKQ